MESLHSKVDTSDDADSIPNMATIFCDICVDDETRVVAEGCCMDCRHYLCPSCFNYHRRPRPCRHHKLLGKDDMPTNLHEQTVPKDECTEMCEIHKDEVLKYYCEDHKLFGCTVCITLEHRTCNVGYIPTLAKTYLESAEYLEFKQDLQSTSEKAKIIEEAASQNIEVTGRNINKVSAEIKSVIDKVTSCASLANSKLIEDLTQQESVKQQCANSTITTCKLIEDDIKKLKMEIGEREMQKLTCSLMMLVKQQLGKIENHKTAVSTMGEMPMRTMQFIPSICIESFLSKTGGIIGYVVTLHAYLPIRMEDDTSDKGTITSLCRLSNGRLAVCDSLNGKIKVIDIKQKHATLSFVAKTVGIAAINDNEIAASHDNEINILTITDTMTKRKSISIEDFGETVIYSDNTFIGYSQKEPKTIRLANLKERVLTDIPNATKGKPLYGRPVYMTFGSDKTRVYISDHAKKVVRCISLDGNILAQHSKQWRPRGVASASDGTVFVVDYDSGNITILTRDLYRICEIKGEQFGIKHPKGLRYDDKERLLYVGMDKSTSIVVLKV